MITRFVIDVLTGKFTRFVAGKQVASDQNNVLTMQDVLNCEVVVVAGTDDVTTTVVPEGYDLRLGLRRFTGIGPSLALSDPHTMEGSVAKLKWRLTTQEIVDLVDLIQSDTAKGAPVNWEAQVSQTVDGEVIARDTLAQVPITLRCEGIKDGDEPPAAAEESAQTAASMAQIATQQAALATEAAQAAGEAAGMAADSATGAGQAKDAAQAAAAQALDAAAALFLGSIAGNAVPATAPHAGSWYIITSAGTSQGIDWAEGNEARYNGAPGSWTRKATAPVGWDSIQDKPLSTEAAPNKVPQTRADGTLAPSFTPHADVLNQPAYWMGV